MANIDVPEINLRLKGLSQSGTMLGVPPSIEKNGSRDVRTFLLIWNSEFNTWSRLPADLQEFRSTKTLVKRWQINERSTIESGDRFFLLMHNSEGRNKIVGSGYAISEISFVSLSAIELNRFSSSSAYIEVEFDMLVDPSKGQFMARIEDLKLNNELTSKLTSETQSEFSLENTIAERLEEIWLTNFYQVLRGSEDRADEFREGKQFKLLSTRYERSPAARARCLKEYGYGCSVCSVDFQKQYGEIGKDFIHVHHLIPLHTRKTDGESNPLTDLRPVCPNCHAMLHREKPALSIEELKARLEGAREKAG